MIVTGGIDEVALFVSVKFNMTFSVKHFTSGTVVLRQWDKETI